MEYDENLKFELEGKSYLFVNRDSNAITTQLSYSRLLVGGDALPFKHWLSSLPNDYMLYCRDCACVLDDVEFEKLMASLWGGFLTEGGKDPEFLPDNPSHYAERIIVNSGMVLRVTMKKVDPVPDDLLERLYGSVASSSVPISEIRRTPCQTPMSS